MKLVFLFILTAVLSGCAGEESQDCREGDYGRKICKPHREPREPREVREPRSRQ